MPTVDLSRHVFFGEQPEYSRSGLQTEFSFVLPRGYVDTAGQVHREGTMRRATARDEILPQNDPKVRENPSYLTVLLLARTVTRLGTLTEVDAWTVERIWLFRLLRRQEGSRPSATCTPPPRSRPTGRR